MGPSPDPDLQVDELKIWVHDREFPDAEDYWDGNWLNVTARFERGQSQVEAKGPILHLSELGQFREQCEVLGERLEGSAKLACMEPNLKLQLDAGTGGAIALTCEITPEHLTEHHRFSSEIDQSYLPKVIAACKDIESKYPLRGKGTDGV